MPNNQFIGRRVSVGLGLESTAGTEVAPTVWARHLKCTFQRKTTTIDNESALGRVEASDDSAIVEQWAEGTLDGKVSDVSIGYLLKNIFGTVANTDNADSNAAVVDHTFDIAQTQVAPTLTIARKDPNSDRRHGFGTLESLEISWKSGDWVKFSSKVKAKNGVTASDTVAYTDENEFTSKHITVKVATNVAGLTGATGLKTKSGSITINRPADLFYPNGQIDPSAITTGAVKVKGEVVVQYEDATLETLWAANTQQALQIILKNTDVTIGAAANPSLTFTLPKARLNSFDMSDDLDDVIEQTVGIKGEYSVADGYMIRGVLTNTTAVY